jgi:hypothetical protein
LILLTVVSVPGAARADLWWDTNGATPGAGPLGERNWTDAFWSTSPAGDIATGSWISGETAVFSAIEQGIIAFREAFSGDEPQRLMQTFLNRRKT